MVPADALSRRHDHAIGLEVKEELIGLPEELFVKLVDIDLRDAVVSGQQSNESAREALAKLADPAVLPTKWHLEGSNDTRCLFYDGKMYVPDDIDLRRRIVADHHDTPVAGHPGVLATTRSVRLSYWWPGMATFMKNYVAGCATCQQFKVNTRPNEALSLPYS